ncbi:MAG: hypothetical protein JXA42_06870 [Anaerolineales bacterium]|nr:hypothetical protein [Anaerolineales bacterium]
MSRFSIINIIKDHLKTLCNFKSGKTNWFDVIVSLIVPIILAIIVVCTNLIRLDNQAIDILVTSLSIFAALLFNLLLLIYDIVSRGTNNQRPLVPKFLGEIYSNVSFSILLSVLAVILLMGAYFVLKIPTNLSFIGKLIDVAVFSLIGQFLFVLLMILKRIHAVLKHVVPPKD